MKMFNTLRVPFLQILLAVVLSSFLTDIAFAQRSIRRSSPEPEKKEAPKTDSTETKNGFKPYAQIIPSSAKTKEGLFTVHEVKGKYFYEIPDSLLGKEMLMVTTIAKTAAGIGYGGERTNTQMLRWDKKNETILLKVVSYSNTAADSLPIFQAVRSSNLEPILQKFDIKTKHPKKENWVIDVTDLFSKDVQAIGLPKNRRTEYKVSRLDTDRSYIESIRPFPLNIEARYLMTYAASEPPSNSSTGLVTVEMNSSMVLLPEVPMRQRLADRRVGWFNTTVTDYGLDEQKATKRTYLDRWRLEVKEADMEKFKAGELVEPKKPIVY